MYVYMYITFCPDFFEMRIYMHVCMYACMYACIYVCMYLCLYVCMYACMYAVVCVFTYMHAYHISALSENSCICMYVGMYMHTYMHMCTSRSDTIPHSSSNTSICAYIYTVFAFGMKYLRSRHTHMYIYTQTCVQTCLRALLLKITFACVHIFMFS